MARWPDRAARGPEATGGAARHELRERRANGARVTGERAPRGFDPARKVDSRPIAMDGQDECKASRAGPPAQAGAEAGPSRLSWAASQPAGLTAEGASLLGERKRATLAERLFGPPVCIVKLKN